MEHQLRVGQTGLLAIVANPRIRVLVVQQVVLEAHSFLKKRGLFLRFGREVRKVGPSVVGGGESCLSSFLFYEFFNSQLCRFF